jgi:hypothetical protein
MKQRNTGRDRPARLARRIVAIAVISAAAAMPASAEFQVDASVVAGGGGRSESVGGCRRLDGTIAETLAGAVSGGAYAISAGHWAGFDTRSRDALFNTGFEECQ